jgi:hypothetical protein
MPTDIYGDLNDMLYGVNAYGDAPGGGAMGYPVRSGPPRSASWLDYLGQMFGASPAAAAEMNPLDALRAGGSPVAPELQGGGPPVPPSVNAPPPAPTMPARPAGVSASGLPLAPGSLSPATLAQFGPNPYMPTPLGGGSYPNPNAPSPAAQPVSAVKGPLAAGGATGASSTSNPRFVQFDRPNMDAAGGARRGGGPAQMTMLNLAGLFGGGQQAVNPNVPAANAQPVSATTPGPLAKRRGTLNLPTSYNIPGSGYRITPQGDVVGTLWGRSAGGNPY